MSVSSYWETLRDDRERRRRAQRTVERQILRATAAEDRRAAGADRAQRTEEARLAREAGEAEAARLNRELDEGLTRLGRVLQDTARLPPRTPDLLRAAVPLPMEEPDDEPVPRPEWSEFAPPEPRWGQGRRHRRAVAEAHAEFERARRTHDRVREERREAQRRRREVAVEEASSRHQARWDGLASGISRGDPDAVRELAAAILSSMPPLAGLVDGGDAVHQPEAAELVIEVALPDTDVVPGERSWKYVHARREVEPQPRSATDAARRYTDLISQLTLSALDGLFRGIPSTVLDTITINGHVPTIDPATGRPALPCLITVTTGRAAFAGLELTHAKLDPARCLRALGAELSPHPYQLQHIEPFIDLDLSRYRLAGGPEALAGLDHRKDLLTMDPFEFERLVKDLFDRMGYRAWRTQASHDDGIDAVAVREDPVTPVQCLIQAKRSRNRVAPEKVQALMGVLAENPTATHGVLVTTSWLSDRARQRARAQRIRTIEGAELIGLIRQHLGRDVLISVRPPRRQTS